MSEATTKRELRVLMLEDTPADAELNERELRKAGILFTSVRVETRDAFIKALEEFRPEVVLSDYKLSDFDGMSALKIVRRDHPEIPVVMVTGALSDIEAVELIHAGAKDYVLKDRLARLGPAVQRVFSMEQGIRARKEAESKFRKISESAQDAIIMMGDKRITFWNSAAERIFGYTAFEAMGQELHSLIAPPQMQAAFEHGYTHFLENGEGPVIGKLLELTALRKGGEEFPVELSVSAVQMNGSWHAIGIVRDISERKQTEAALFEAQQVFRSLIENSPDIIARYDRDCRRTYVNPTYLKVAEISQQELLSTAPRQRSPLPAASAEALQNLLRRVLDSGVAEAIDLIWPRSDNVVSWYNIFAFPEFDHEGRVVSVMTISRDITERKRAEKMLNASHELLQSVVENAPIRVFWKDAELRYLGCNTAFARDAGLSRPEELVGKDDFQMGWHEQADLYRADDKRVMDSGMAKIGYEEPQTTPDGHTIWLRSSKVPLRNPEGKTIGMLGIYEDITERKQAEEALHQNETELKEAQRIAHLGSWHLDVATNQVVWSEELYKMYGFDPALPPPPYTEHMKLFTPESWEKLSQALAHTRETGTPYELELKTVQKDGGLGWMWVRGERVNDATGTVVGLHGVAMDITERKAAEAGLKLFRALIDQSSDAIEVNDTETLRFIDVNKTACRILGYSRDELLSMRIQDIDPDMDEQQIRKIGENLQARGVAIIETRHRRKDGTTLPVEVSVTSVRLDREYGISMVRDITERKNAEEALRESEQKFRAIFDHASDGIIVMDIDEHTVKFANASMERMLGYGQGELIGLQMSQLHPPEALAQVGTQFDKDTRGNPSMVQDMPMLTKDGRVLYADLNGSPVDIGGQRYLLGAFRDATERRKTEITLLHLNRTLRALSAGNHALVHAGNEKELLENMCRATAEAGYVLAWVGYALQDEKKSIVPMAVYGESRAYVETQNITWDELPSGYGPTGAAVRTGQTQIVNDIANDPRMEPWREATAKFGLAASIALPLKDDGKFIGSLTIYAAETGAFGPEQVALLEEMASDLAFGIVTLRIRIEHEQQATILRESLEQSIQTIADTVEARDPYTAGHQRRVSELATAIAHEMGLPEQQVNGIHLAGIIHDLGKIHVPAEILSKPGKLNDIEFQLIKMHPQAGYDILKHVKFPWPIADIVRQHHERLDGSGYPQGLKGDAILIESRIMAVADVLEAMSSHRPYRPGLGIDVALKEIERGRDSAYDPVVVDACLKLFAEKRFTFSSSSS